MNTLESEVIRKCAMRAEIDIFGCVFIFNTCAVTAEAERQAGQALRKCRRENPNAIIILTGCSANASNAKYATMDEVDFVIGNKEKMQQKTYNEITRILKNKNNCSEKKYEKNFVQDLKNSVIDLSDDMDFSVENFEGRTRAFIQIQQGCRNRCAFCIVPNLRGNSISFSRDAIFSQIESVVKNRYKEIVLTGVDIASYDSKSLSTKPLTNLIRDILKCFPQIERLRLSSLDPACNYDDLIAFAKNDSRIMPHFHLSLQHASNDILRAMKRRHTRQQALTLCKNLRAKLGPHVAIGADVITGFPNETDADFKSLLRFIKQARITHLHTFVYSPRPDTFAGDNMIDNVPKNVAKERAKILRKIADKNLQKLLKISAHKTKSILLEGDGKSGYTENYIRCNMENFRDGNVLSENDIVHVHVLKNTRRKNDDLELNAVAIPVKKRRKNFV